MSNQYGYKIILDGTIDITDKVKSFTIDCALENYCRELSFDLYDTVLFDSFDFSIIPEDTRIEVFTRITDEYDEYDEYQWESQGKFFIERPTFQVGVNETSTGIWGRQSTAVLGEPFAQKVTKQWSENTTLYAIFQEILESVGLVWDSTKCDIQDVTIYADNFEADNQYPIEVLQNLIELIVGAEGFITSDRLGNICIKKLIREPDASDFNITDLIVQSINEEPEWPEFGNRIKIIPAETTSQNKIDMSVSSECLGTSAGIVSYIDIFAQCRNGDGVPINDALVTWRFSPVNAEKVWFKYPSLQKTVSQNSGRVLISKEMKRANGFRKIETEYEADSIVGIWAYADKTRLVNFAPVGGYVIDGKEIYLTTTQFVYCDQMVLISYYASGMVINSVVYDESITETNPEPLYGEVDVIASLAGVESIQTIYVNNSCQCKNTLNVNVDPSSIEIGTQAKIIAYVENGGMPVSGIVHMTEMTRKGTLQWTSRKTDSLLVSGEKTEALNSISGVTQCVLSSAISSVVSVYQTDVDGNIISENLYSSFYGRTIDLTVHLETGTLLVVNYNRAGSVENYLTGLSAGTAQITISLDVNTEEGLSQIASITITQPDAGIESGGGGVSLPDQDVYIAGPGVVNPPSISGGSSLVVSGIIPPPARYGGWNLALSDPSLGGSIVTTAMSVEKAWGYVHVIAPGPGVYLFRLEIYAWFQTITIKVSGRLTYDGKTTNVDKTMDVVLKGFN